MKMIRHRTRFQLAGEVLELAKEGTKREKKKDLPPGWITSEVVAELCGTTLQGAAMCLKRCAKHGWLEPHDTYSHGELGKRKAKAYKLTKAGEDFLRRRRRRYG